MVDTNYIGGVIKILETPKQKLISDNIVVTQFRAQLPQYYNTQLINLTFWGHLAEDVKNYYKINDYILIEGYLSLRNKSTPNIIYQRSKTVEITVVKIYPFFSKLAISYF